MSPTRSVPGLFSRSSRLAMTAVALVIAVMSSLLAGVVLATPAGAATAASLDQCANGPLADPVDCSDSADWVNGNLGASKAHYFEGDSIPYRMVMTGLTVGTEYTVTVEWDTTKGGKHAIDYITTFDRTVTGADPCAGIAGCGGTPSTFPIPTDPNVTNAGVTQLPGEFTLYGGTITAVSPYTLSGTYAGDSSTRITVTFVATSTTSVLAWGGHISSRQDWGMANSAVAITGSPYHTRLIDFDGKGGNQDRSLAAAAVIFPASITIIKDAVPNDAQDFNFSTTGGLLPATFSLDDDADPTLSNTQTFTNITTFGAYTITEAAAAGWTLSFGTPPCTVTSPNGGSRTVVLATVTLDLREGENVTCTFINTRQSGTLTVNKVVSPASDPGLFNLQIDGATAGTGANVGNGGTTGPIVLATGSHSVGETAGTGTSLADYTSSISCSNGAAAANAGPLQVEVTNNAAVTCTITNTRQTGTLTVNKVVSPSSDPGLFNLQIDGSTAGTGANVGNGGTTGAIPVNTGAHTVGETAGTGTTLADYSSNISCSDGTVLMGSGGPLQVNVPNSINVVCTITNTRRTGTLTVNKVVSPTNDPGLFNLQIDGNTAGSGANVGHGGSTGPIQVTTGMHTVGELAGTNTSLADYISSIDCGGGPIAGVGPLPVQVTDGGNVVCTIVNIRRTGTLTVNKVVSPASDPGLFDLQIDGSTAGTGADVGNGGTTGQITVNTGTHTVGELAGTNTSLADYDSSISCTDGAAASNAGPLQVQVTDGANVVCTITNTRQTGTITVNKVVSPANDAGLFNLQIDGSTAGTGADAGHGGTTGQITVNTGAHSVGEIAGTGTSLADYTSSISCTGGEAIGDAGPLAVVVSDGENVVCTITNIRQTGTLTVNKVLSPASDPSLFNLQIDGSTAGTGANVGNGGTTGAIPVNTGPHTVGETAGTGTTLADYTASISCSDGTVLIGSGPLQVTVTDNINVVCTITNTRRTGTLTVNKVVSPASDPGLFNLQIDGSTAGTGANVGNGGTTGPISVITGAHTVGETAGTGTTLADYTSSIACTGGATAPNAGPLQVTVTDGANVVCTITNTRISECPPTIRIAHNRGNPCPREDPEDDPIDNPVVPTVDTPSVPGPTAPTADPEVGGAGDTNPLQPVDQVLGSTTEQPAANPGLLGGFLPRTGAGIAGQAMLALLLMAAGLTLRLARRRRAPQA